MELVQRNFYWPHMTEWITDYVGSCDECQNNKSIQHKKYGLLQPLKTRYDRWTSVSTNFMVQLPESWGSTQICVIVDRFAKMGHFILLRENATASDIAWAFLDNVWNFPSLPQKSSPAVRLNLQANCGSRYVNYEKSSGANLPPITLKLID